LGLRVQRFVFVEGAFLRLGWAVATLYKYGAGGGYGCLPRSEMGWVIIVLHLEVISLCRSPAIGVARGFFLPCGCNTIAYMNKKYDEETESFTARLPRSLRARIKAVAKANRRSESEVVALLLGLGFENPLLKVELPHMPHSQSEPQQPP